MSCRALPEIIAAGRATVPSRCPPPPPTLPFPPPNLHLVASLWALTMTTQQPLSPTKTSGLSLEGLRCPYQRAPLHGLHRYRRLRRTSPPTF